MLYSDGNGFPLTVKPSHLYGSTERMDTAEILAAIVEQACLYMPESSVGVKNVEKSERGAYRGFKAPKEALFEDDKDSPKEALTVVKVPAASSSNFVGFK